MSGSERASGGGSRWPLNRSDADFHEGQWESIEHLLAHRRVLVVQRTGWGKSMVYFLATRLIRDQGAGFTLLISPLLSLMRNQLEAAERIGITARAINYTNRKDWDEIQRELFKDEIDVLLISPERLANENFRQNVLLKIAEHIGLFVVDEAHCISDWGHDFRPDYRRITRVLQSIPSNVPVLATTATANDRVVDDIQEQMSGRLLVERGPLVRKSLRLQNISLPDKAARLAWLARTIPSIERSGIVYTLTQRDAERVADWLNKNDISAKSYHAGSEDRGALEQELLNNDLKVLVATVALGMGFDKPDIGFVIHFQRPSSVVHYYQQVGRAGRAVDGAYGILLCGEEDDRIADYFIRSAFPPQKHIREILQVLDESSDGLSTTDLQHLLNLRSSQISKAMKFLSVESPSPVVKIDRKWRITSFAEEYHVNQEYIDSIISTRRYEQNQMKQYMQHTGCLMAFLQEALDDSDVKDCGKCHNCNPDLLLSEDFDIDLASRAAQFLKHSYLDIKPRKVWPGTGMFQYYSFEGYRISPELRANKGKALSLWGDAGWGELVTDGKYRHERFSEDLVHACVEMIREWNPAPFPEWVTCIPSSNLPDLVPDFAGKLAGALGIKFVSCIQINREHRQQKEMQNSYHQAKNLDGAFLITDECMTGECLLVDDMIDSGWTLTVASALLRQAGCRGVYPLALARTSPKMG